MSQLNAGSSKLYVSSDVADVPIDALQDASRETRDGKEFEPNNYIRMLIQEGRRSCRLPVDAE